MPWFSTSSTAFSVDHLAVDQGLGLLLEQDAAGLADRHLPLLALLGHDLLEHVLEIDVHVLHAEVGEDLHRHRLLLDVQLDRAVFQLAGLEAGLHLLAGALAGVRSPRCCRGPRCWTWAAAGRAAVR